MELDAADEANQTIMRLLGRLDERQRWIVTRHFGLAGDDAATDQAEPRTLAEIAEQLHITPAEARRVERRALAALREAAKETDVRLDDALPPDPALGVQ